MPAVHIARRRQPPRVAGGIPENRSEKELESEYSDDPRGGIGVGLPLAALESRRRAAQRNRRLASGEARPPLACIAKRRKS